VTAREHGELLFAGEDAQGRAVGAALEANGYGGARDGLGGRQRNHFEPRLDSHLGGGCLTRVEGPRALAVRQQEVNDDEQRAQDPSGEKTQAPG
jgi:hypothetical protein